MAGRRIGHVLAGGAGRRMGGVDKAFLVLGGRPLIAHILDRLRPQVDRVTIGANGDPARFDGFGCTVIDDGEVAGEGPLAGLLAGLRAIDPGDWLLTAPCDAPFLPADLAARLLAGRGDAPAALARAGGRLHPVFGLWRGDVAAAVAAELAAGRRRVIAFAERIGAAVVDWPETDAPAFANLNSHEDLAQAEARWRSGQPARDVRA